MIETHGSFYVSEEIEKIKNPSLRDLLLEAFAEKGDNPIFIVDGQKIVFPESKYSSRRLADYKNKLIRWAEDPHFPSDNIEALGLEVLIKLMLRETLKDDRDIVVALTPSTVDFIEKKLPDGIKPIALISATLTSHHGKKINQKLKVPIINVSGIRLFGGKEQFYINLFASSPLPSNFATSLADRSSFAPKLQSIVNNFKLK